MGQTNREDFVYNGECFRDNWNRLLNGLIRKQNDFITIENCIEFCSVYGYAFAGVENEKECFCGQNAPTADPLPNSNCNEKCRGDQTQICGGNWAINIYSIPKAGISIFVAPIFRQLNRQK